MKYNLWVDFFNNCRYKSIKYIEKIDNYNNKKILINYFLFICNNSTFNWVVPWLSWLAVIVLIIASVIFYYIPLRYLLLLFGKNSNFSFSIH